MGADRARELDEAQKARPAAIDLGDAPDQPHDLADDEHDVENRARTDRGHQRHALRGGGDLGFRLQVERTQQRALGDVDEVAPVDDRARRVLDLGPRARRLRPVAIERDKLADEASRRDAVVGRARLRQLDMDFRDPRLPRDRDDLAHRDANEADQEHEAERDPDDPERFGLGEQPFDEVGRPQAQRERDEAAETRPDESGEGQARAGDEARFLRRLDLELRLVDRRRLDGGGNWVVLRLNDRFGRVWRGPIVDRDASVVEAKGAGAGRARSCETVPDQELQRAVEPDLRRGLAALGQAAGGSARTASRCRLRAARSRRPRRSPPGRPAIPRERRPLPRRRRTSARRSSRPSPARR